MQFLKTLILRFRESLRPYDPATDPRWQQLADDIIAAGKVTEACALIDHWLANPKALEQALREQEHGR